VQYHFPVNRRGETVFQVEGRIECSKLGEERFHLELRADFVNAVNHPSLGLPGNIMGGGNFGQINNATQGGGVAVAPRSGQLSAVFSF
jgi:hypothetical protein